MKRLENSMLMNVSNPVFALKYKLYMPTEEEFKKELKLDDYKKIE